MSTPMHPGQHPDMSGLFANPIPPRRFTDRLSGVQLKFPPKVPGSLRAEPGSKLMLSDCQVPIAPNHTRRHEKPGLWGTLSGRDQATSSQQKGPGRGGAPEVTTALCLCTWLRQGAQEFASKHLAVKLKSSHLHTYLKEI